MHASQEDCCKLIFDKGKYKLTRQIFTGGIAKSVFLLVPLQGYVSGKQQTCAHHWHHSLPLLSRKLITASQSGIFASVLRQVLVMYRERHIFLNQHLSNRRKQAKTFCKLQSCRYPLRRGAVIVPQSKDNESNRTPLDNNLNPVCVYLSIHQTNVSGEVQGTHGCFWLSQDQAGLHIMWDKRISRIPLVEIFALCEHSCNFYLSSRSVKNHCVHT